MIFEQDLDNFGIICRGKSLERLPEVIDKFDDCFIVNSFNKEFHVFGKHIFSGKKVMQFINADQKSFMEKPLYKAWNIDSGLATWTSKHLLPGKGKPNALLAMGIYPRRLNLELLHDKYYPICNAIKNSGVLLTLIVSEELKPKTLWIVGLDFYAVDYMVMKRRKFQMENINRGMIKHLKTTFIDIVKDHPSINYKLVTYYPGQLPQLANLEVFK